jgi:hypothetical protein
MSFSYGRGGMQQDFGVTVRARSGPRSMTDENGCSFFLYFLTLAGCVILSAVLPSSASISRDTVQ